MGRTVNPSAEAYTGSESVPPHCIIPAQGMFWRPRESLHAGICQCPRVILRCWHFGLTGQRMITRRRGSAAPSSFPGIGTVLPNPPRTAVRRLVNLPVTSDTPDDDVGLAQEGWALRGPYLAGRLQAALAWWGARRCCGGAQPCDPGMGGLGKRSAPFDEHLWVLVPDEAMGCGAGGCVGVAILTQIGCPSRSRERQGFGLALVAGVVAVVFMIEYATGRSFGLIRCGF